MAVRKFRTVQDMKRPRWRQPGDPALYAAIARVWDFGRRSGAHRFPPGVYRHHSVEELNALTNQWSVANFEARKSAWYDVAPDG